PQLRGAVLGESDKSQQQKQAEQVGRVGNQVVEGKGAVAAGEMVLEEIRKAQQAEARQQHMVDFVLECRIGDRQGLNVLRALDGHASPGSAADRVSPFVVVVAAKIYRMQVTVR